MLYLSSSVYDMTIIFNSFINHTLHIGGFDSWIIRINEMVLVRGGEIDALFLSFLNHLYFEKKKKARSLNTSMNCFTRDDFPKR